MDVLDLVNMGRLVVSSFDKFAKKRSGEGAGIIHGGGGELF